MQKFNNLKGVAAPFNFMNVDTDKIIPKQFLKTIKRTGLGKHLFDEMRFKDDGSEREDFSCPAPLIIRAATFGRYSSITATLMKRSPFSIRSPGEIQTLTSTPDQTIFTAP